MSWASVILTCCSCCLSETFSGKMANSVPFISLPSEVGESVINSSSAYVCLAWQFHNTTGQPHMPPLLLATIYSQHRCILHKFHEVMAALRATNLIAFLFSFISLLLLQISSESDISFSHFCSQFSVKQKACRGQTRFHWCYYVI